MSINFLKVSSKSTYADARPPQLKRARKDHFLLLFAAFFCSPTPTHSSPLPSPPRPRPYPRPEASWDATVAVPRGQGSRTQQALQSGTAPPRVKLVPLWFLPPAASFPFFLIISIYFFFSSFFHKQHGSIPLSL